MPFSRTQSDAGRSAPLCAGPISSVSGVNESIDKYHWYLNTIGMGKRLRRSEQVAQNRTLLLAAARAVFLASGYVRATIDAVAEEAGFSKGVVYSQFESKADLFLALLEQRISERAAQNETAVRGLRGARAILALMRTGEKDAQADSGWPGLLVEFRAQAQRDPTINARYAVLHQETVRRLAEVLAILYADAGIEAPHPHHVGAELILAFATGLTLERAANPRALPSNEAQAALIRALGFMNPAA